MEGIKAGHIKKYVTDFPNTLTAGKPGVIATPHLGASTAESEENCAEMAVKEIIDYLENGNIIHSVNYPDCDMGICGTEGRLAILHQNSKGMIAQYTAILGDAGINISDMTNKGKGDFAYSLVDYEGKLSPDTVKALEEIPEVYKVRVIKG
jgi:D-3-phosphoglycerate dehydrogenase